MSEGRPELSEVIEHAPVSDLIHGLALRGAKTRRLTGGKLKISIVVEDKPKPKRRRRMAGEVNRIPPECKVPKARIERG